MRTVIIIDCFSPIVNPEWSVHCALSPAQGLPEMAFSDERRRPGFGWLEGRESLGCDGIDTVPREQSGTGNR
jgi:hypothetical protein